MQHDKYLENSQAFSKLSKLLAQARRKIAEESTDNIAEQAKVAASILEQFVRLTVSCCRLSYRAVKHNLIAETQQLDLLIGSMWSMIRKADHTLKEVEVRVVTQHESLPGAT